MENISNQPSTYKKSTRRNVVALEKGKIPPQAVEFEEAVLGAMAEDIVWNEAENYPYADGNPYVGPQAVAEGVFARIGAEWEYFELDVQDSLQDGNRIAFFGRYNAKHRESGKTMSAQFVHVWTLVDGKAARFQQYADTAQTQAAMRD